MPVRVLMVVPHGWRTGANAELVDLAAAAPAGDLAVTVVLLRPGPVADDLRAAGVPVRVVERDRRARSPRGLARVTRGLLAAIVAARPDVVYPSEAMGQLFAALPAAVAGVPVVWRQASWPEPGTPRQLDAAATLLPARLVVAVSDAVAAQQRTLRGGPPVRVVRPGIDLSRFASARPDGVRAAHGIPPDAVLVGIVGRLDRWKGQDVFLRMAAEVARDRPGVRFAVVGGADAGEDPAYPGELRALAAQLGLAGRVTFTGATSEVPAWMAALDVVVNASRAEPFGLVVVEAMAAGRPVVAVAAGGPAETLAHLRTGVLAPRATPADLAAAVAPLVDDPSLRAAIGAAARDQAHREHGRERLARELGAVLAEVALG